jgi:hypothetical protein
MMLMVLFIDSEKKMCFPSYNFHLKKRLGKPVQFKTRLQSRRTHQPVRTNLQLSFNPMNKASWESLLGLQWVSLGHGMAMSGQGGVTNPKQARVGLSGS